MIFARRFEQSIEGIHVLFVNGEKMKSNGVGLIEIGFERGNDVGKVLGSAGGAMGLNRRRVSTSPLPPNIENMENVEKRLFLPYFYVLTSFNLVPNAVPCGTRLARSLR